MAGSTQDNNWPLPKFYFSVTGLNGKTDPVPFQEVTGLSSETTPIEYRHGDSKSFYPIKGNSDQAAHFRGYLPHFRQ